MDGIKKQKTHGDGLDQLPPHDPDAEKAVLGSIVLDRNAIDDLNLQSDDFHADPQLSAPRKGESEELKRCCPNPFRQQFLPIVTEAGDPGVATGLKT